MFLARITLAASRMCCTYQPRRNNTSRHRHTQCTVATRTNTEANVIPHASYTRTRINTHVWNKRRWKLFSTCGVESLRVIHHPQSITVASPGFERVKEGQSRNIESELASFSGSLLDRFLLKTHCVRLVWFRVSIIQLISPLSRFV